MTKPRSYRPMVQTIGDPKFYGNAVRYETEAEALADAANLSLRWTAVVDFRAEESEDTVNRRWDPEFGSIVLVPPVES